MSVRRIKLAVLVSGGGRSLQNLLDLSAGGQLPAEVALVVASRPGIGALDRAAAVGVPAEVVDRRQFDGVEPFSDRIFSLCDRVGAELIVFAGWLSLVRLPSRYAGRAINIHPALLPSFGGKGMYGHHVHEAVLAHGCKLSGCSVHFVDNTYDTGPIILQRVCPVQCDDTPDTLARRVFDEELIALPEAIRLIAENRLRLDGRIVRVSKG